MSPPRFTPELKYEAVPQITERGSVVVDPVLDHQSGMCTEVGLIVGY